MQGFQLISCKVWVHHHKIKLLSLVITKFFKVIGYHQPNCVRTVWTSCLRVSLTLKVAGYSFPNLLKFGWPYRKNEILEVKKISITRIFKSIHKNCLMGFSHNMSILITITMLHPLLWTSILLSTQVWNPLNAKGESWFTSLLNIACHSLAKL